MEGSEHRIRKLAKRVLSAAVLVGVVAVAGCGGGGGGSTAAKAPTPVNKSSSTPGGVVSAEGTLGLVGPAGRATAKKQQFEDQKSKISAKANQKPGNRKKPGGVGAGDSCNDRDLTPSDSDIDQLNASILCLVNGQRTDFGLPTLNHSSQLDQSAAGMCQRMVTEHFFSHETPDGKTVVDRVQPTGYIPKSGDWVVGENLAWGSGALSTPQAIVNGWMNSPGHRANILAPDYKDIGLAACMGSPLTTSSGGTVYVNNFGAQTGADLNASLPPEGASAASTGNTSASSSSSSNQTTAGTRASKAKRRAACLRRAKKVHSSKRRARAVKRCRHA
jgi:uncharacterized protein YkwD